MDSESYTEQRRRPGRPDSRPLEPCIPGRLLDASTGVRRLRPGSPYVALFICTVTLPGTDPGSVAALTCVKSLDVDDSGVTPPVASTGLPAFFFQQASPRPVL